MIRREKRRLWGEKLSLCTPSSTSVDLLSRQSQDIAPAVVAALTTTCLGSSDKTSREKSRNEGRSVGEVPISLPPCLIGY